MGAQIATLEDLLKVKEEILLAIELMVKGHEGPDKKWLRSKEFMDKFSITDPHYLATLRARKQVRWEKRGKFFYYDPSSYLPS